MVTMTRCIMIIYYRLYGAMASPTPATVRSQADGGCDAIPGLVRRSLQPAQVDGGHCQIGVVEESADRFHRLPGVAPEFRCRVAQDVQPRLLHAGFLQVAAEPQVDGPAGDAGSAGPRLPDGR